MFKTDNSRNREYEKIIDVYVDETIYHKFISYLIKNKMDEGDTLSKILENGMKNYWLIYYKNLKSNLKCIEPLYEECKRDNEILKSLERQNNLLKEYIEKMGVT